MQWRNLLLGEEAGEIGGPQLLIYLLLHLHIHAQYLVLLSGLRTVERPQLLNLLLIIAPLLLKQLLVEHQIPLRNLPPARVEQSIFIGEAVDDRVDEGGTNTIDEFVDFVVIGMQAVGQTLDRQIGT